MSVDTCIRRRLAEMKSSTFKQRLVKPMIKKYGTRTSLADNLRRPLLAPGVLLPYEAGGLSTLVCAC